MSFIVNVPCGGETHSIRVDDDGRAVLVHDREMVQAFTAFGAKVPPCFLYAETIEGDTLVPKAEGESYWNLFRLLRQAELDEVIALIALDWAEHVVPQITKAHKYDKDAARAIAESRRLLMSDAPLQERFEAMHRLDEETKRHREHLTLRPKKGATVELPSPGSPEGMQRDAAHSAYNAVEHAIGATIEAMVPQWTPHKGTRRRLSGRYAEKVADHARDAAGAGLMAVTQRLGVDPLDAMYEAAMEEAEWQRKALLKRLHGLELHWAD